jgi:hypothetical protein
MIKHIGIEQVELITSNALLGMMSLLKQRGFNFKFLLMSDYRSHPYLGKIIRQFQSHMIELGTDAGMKEYVASLKLNTEDHLHPDAQGHLQIAQVVMKQLSKEL